MNPETIDKIKHLHAKLTEWDEGMLGHAQGIGKLLLSVKANIRHGEFEKWVKDNLPFSPRTARNYVRVFEQSDELSKAGVKTLTVAYTQLKPEPNRKLLSDLAHNYTGIAQLLPIMEELCKTLRDVLNKAQKLGKNPLRDKFTQEIKTARQTLRDEIERTKHLVRSCGP